MVNTNRIRPPIAPIGLDYLAEALEAAGHRVSVLDLCWADDWVSAVSGFFREHSPGVVGVTLRNTDDCAFASRASFLIEFATIAAALRSHTEAPVVVGGVGFSALPEQVLALCQVDAGVWGEGEFTFVELARRVECGCEWRNLPNLVCRDGEGVRRNPVAFGEIADLPPMSRSWIDNPRYFREGGQAGFETKRGCSGHCVYCADPVAKGRRVRLRSPHAVVEELQCLLAQGIDHLHTCDSEFNVPAWHAEAMCEEIANCGLGERLRWYAYCSPAGFSAELARLMRRAGCVGINFGVDSGDAEMLARLGRDFAPQDIVEAARACGEAGLAVMLDLLLGSPGETVDSLARTLELMKRTEADRVGVALGVRVYPGTELASEVAQGKLSAGLVGGEAGEPLFYLAPEVAEGAPGLLARLTGDDPRFLFFNPAEGDRNYNYNANQLLCEAIQAGYRGAYWDILRRWHGKG